MKKLLVVVGMALTLPLFAQGQNAPAEVPFRAGGTTPLATNANAPAPRMPDGSIDLWGTWVGGGPINDIEKDGGMKPGELDKIMQPWAIKLRDSRKDPEDPHNFCLPMGVPRQAGAFPWRFVQYPTHKAATHMFILWEGFRNYRQIFMDGRKHPAELDPTWFGHSIGWYEGDTLVVDTVGFNDKFWFDRRGHPHTEQLHTIERFTRKDMGHMEIKVTVDDPGAYSKPFTMTFNARLSNPGDELMEYICQENNQYGIAGGYPNPLAKPADK